MLKLGFDEIRSFANDYNNNLNMEQYLNAMNLNFNNDPNYYNHGGD